MAEPNVDDNSNRKFLLKTWDLEIIENIFIGIEIYYNYKLLFNIGIGIYLYKEQMKNQFFLFK